MNKLKEWDLETEMCLACSKHRKSIKWVKKSKWDRVGGDEVAGGQIM